MRMDKQVCALHDIPFNTGESEIIYGLWAPSAEYRSASSRLFPNSFLQVPGGCFYSSEFPHKQVVSYCPRCRQVELEWKPFADTF